MKRTELKRNTHLTKVSSKMRKQKVQEAKLTQELLENSNGVCALCGRAPDFRGLAKHEIVHRSQGGSAIDPNNTILICGRCHSKQHGINEVTA
jgi:5-methylcytosine-specific restriction endonuclease McrA